MVHCLFCFYFCEETEAVNENPYFIGRKFTAHRKMGEGFGNE
jgi:hypothetical protein